MHGVARLALVIGLFSIPVSVQAIDRGQFNHVPEEIRSWFKSVTAPNGVPCCDMSDGHRTGYDMREGAYWVPVDGKWMAVPDQTIIRNTGNPTGEAVVWYIRIGDTVIIRCFVPASEV